MNRVSQYVLRSMSTGLSALRGLILHEKKLWLIFWSLWKINVRDGVKNSLELYTFCCGLIENSI